MINHQNITSSSVSSQSGLRLDRRLGTIAGMVNPQGESGVRLADIGADHGYLVAWLALEGKIAKGYACDINPQPLERSRRTIERYGVQRLVEPLLSDGLSSLRPEQVDWVVVAGMGGDLIARILENGGDRWRRAPHGIRYLLQPNTKGDHLRRWLRKNGFCTVEEKVAEEGKFVYPILKAVSGRMELSDRLLPLYDTAGLTALGDTPLSPEERRYLSRRRQAALLRLEGLRAMKNPDAAGAAEIGQLEEIVEALSARIEE